MYNRIEITDKVFLLVTNDRRTELFENYWPIEAGVSYNSYLISDEKVVVVDTVERSKVDDFLEKIKNEIGERPVDYLVINHMEPDHSAGIKAFVREYPNVKIIGNKMTFSLIEGFYGIKENQIIVKDGDELNIGEHTLKFVFTPWVHWPETMMTYEINNKILFSGDAFGSFGTLDGGVFDDELNLEFYRDEMLRYYSNIVGKYSDKANEALKKLQNTEVKLIAPTHGPVWRSQVSYIVDLYNRWTSYDTDPGVVVVFGSMYGNTEKMADVIGRRLAENGIKNLRIYDASKTHISYIIRDIWKFKGLIIGTATYNGGAFTPIEHLIQKIEDMGIKNHYLGLFGSSSWNRAGMIELNKFAEKINWDLVYKPVDTKGSPNEETFKYCNELADAMAAKLKQ